ncbi:FecR family protein [Pedobacter sp. GR22-6]|uniref:FecR family protein n=1 Tax=Pedobacter sp. GR22-6 TaxID=3127957 RepID=UPI00307D0CFA
MIENKEYIEALLFEKITGTISEEENLVVENAILQDAETRALWEKLQSKMNQTAARDFISGLDPDLAWVHTAEMIQEKPKPYVRRLSWQIAGIAAVLALVLPLGWHFLNHRSTELKEKQMYTAKEIYLKTDDGELIPMGKPQQISIGSAKINATAEALNSQAASGASDSWATVVVPSTKDYKITLADGTAVWMNSASSLRFPLSFGKGSREVFLKGEAYFDVTRNPAQQFIVHTDYADIKVHGTSFNVHAYEEGTFSTALVEGSVSAMRQGQELRLSPGQKTFLLNDNLGKGTFDPLEELAWMKGVYTFHNRSLAEIAPVISRWFDVKVAWAQENVANQTFTGEIDRQLPLAVVLSNLQLASGIRADIKNGVLTFK